MKKRINILIALVCLSALSLAFVGCEEPEPNNLDGTWVGTDGYGETATIIISGNNMELRGKDEDGNNYRVRGTVTYTNSTITFTQKERYSGGSWASITQSTSTENYRLSGNQLTLVNGGDSITFTKQ